MEKSKDEKLQASAEQQAERLRIFKKLLQPKPVEELTPKKQKEVLKIREVDKIPRSAEHRKTYKNEYDENADFIINCCWLLKQEQFSLLPDVDSETVYYIIKRTQEGERFFTHQVITCQYKVIQQYQKGTKKKSEISQQKWALAQQYFAEEIPKHKTLLSARKAAAKRAGINVNDRRLIQMLPVEK